MKKSNLIKTLGLAAVMSLSMGMVSFAGQEPMIQDGVWTYSIVDGDWQHDGIGWKWVRDLSYNPNPATNYNPAMNGWFWIDGNDDYVAECYYFDSNHYCLLNTTTPDNYQVDENGAWIVDGVVQTIVYETNTAIFENREIPPDDGSGDRIITDEMHKELQDEIDRVNREESERLLEQFEDQLRQYYGK